MIQHEYRKIHSPASMMMPSSDAVCPRCRHVFPAMTSQSSNTKQEESTSLFDERNPFTEYCAKPVLHAEDNSLTSCVETEIPPTPPPRLKPVLYANIPPTSTTPSTNTKPYVTMSNINLQSNGFVSSNQPNFVPLSSPTINCQPTVMTSNPLIKQPPPTIITSNTNISEAMNVMSSNSNCTNNRVYRQLSGGGLVQDSRNNGIRIHEPQPMHQMSGGGLVNTRIDDLFPESSALSLPLRTDYSNSKSTKLLISTTDLNSPSTTSISISPLSASSNISILVPTSLNTSLEISPNSINITVPRASPTLNQSQNSHLSNFKHSNSNPIFQTVAPIRRNASQRQTRRGRGTTPTVPSDQQQVFFPSIVAPEFLLQFSKSQITPVDDIKCLTQTVNRLKESGWFHEGLSWNESETLLTGSTNGTFIVRESSNPNFLFAITVQTEQEPTSVRIQYDNGRFRLDCVTHVTPIVPQFDCVVDLIEYYVTKHNSRKSKNHSHNQKMNNNFLGNQVFVDENGQINSVVSLNKPLRSSVPSLTHCARLTINRQLRYNKHYSKSELSEIVDHLELPKSLKIYLLQYPYVL